MAEETEPAPVAEEPQPAAAEEAQPRVKMSREIYAFAHMMQVRLDEKEITEASWRKLHPAILREKLNELVKELRGGIQRKDFAAVEDATADIALASMMIFDNIWFYRESLETIGWRNGPVLPVNEPAPPVDAVAE